MTLIKTGLLNAVAVSIRLLSMLVLNKILALMIGPSGYGLIGQLQNIVTTITTLGSAGIGTGITKYTAEYHCESNKQSEVWATATFLGAISSLIVSVFIIIFREKLAHKLLGSNDYSYIFFWMAGCLSLYVLNTNLLAILNGLKEIKIFVVINIANSAIALVLIGFLSWIYGIHGALIALAINQSVVCIVTVILVRKFSWFKLSNFLGLVNLRVAQKLSSYSLMAFATSVLGPLTLIVVRNTLVSYEGIEAAGYWEAMSRISNMYLLFISTPLSIYYLPKLSQLTEPSDFYQEIVNGLKIIVPITFLLAGGIYIFRKLIISLLFSDNFSPMINLFEWQLVGDIFRVTAWIFSFLLISRAMTKEFLISEILVSITFIFLSKIFVNIFGFYGISIAYAINNLIYLIVLVIFSKNLLTNKNIE